MLVWCWANVADVGPASNRPHVHQTFTALSNDTWPFPMAHFGAVLARNWEVLGSIPVRCTFVGWMKCNIDAWCCIQPVDGHICKYVQCVNIILNIFKMIAYFLLNNNMLSKSLGIWLQLWRIIRELKAQCEDTYSNHIVVNFDCSLWNIFQPETKI